MKHEPVEDQKPVVEEEEEVEMVQEELIYDPDVAVGKCQGDIVLLSRPLLSQRGFKIGRHKYVLKSICCYCKFVKLNEFCNLKHGSTFYCIVFRVPTSLNILEKIASFSRP